MWREITSIKVIGSENDSFVTQLFCPKVYYNIYIYGCHIEEIGQLCSVMHKYQVVC